MPPPDLKSLVDPATGKTVNVFSLLGSIKSEKKAAASRRNGLKGGIAKGTKLNRAKKAKPTRKVRAEKADFVLPHTPVQNYRQG